MPSKKNTLTIETADKTMTFTSPPCEYAEVYEEDFILDNNDTLHTIAEFDTTTRSVDKHLGYKSLVLQNIGDCGIELKIKHDSFTHDATAGDNKYLHMVLAKDEFFHVHTDFIDFDSATVSAANSQSRSGDLLQTGVITSGVTTAEALDAVETEITTSANGGNMFRIGDYIAVDCVDADADNVDNTEPFEMMKVTAINSDTSIEVERGVLGTTAVVHDTGITIFYVNANLLAPFGKPVAVTHDNSIAIVNSNPDTITDANSNLISDGHHEGMSTKVFIEGESQRAGYITSVSSGALTLHNAGNPSAIIASADTEILSAYLTTNDDGMFHSKNLFAPYGRTTSTGARGIVPGSVQIKFAIPGVTQLAYTDGNSELTANTTYRFDLSIDGQSSTIEFTPTNTTWVEVRDKIQQAIDAKVEDGTYRHGADVIRSSTVSPIDNQSYITHEVGMIEGGYRPLVLVTRTRMVTAGGTVGLGASAIRISDATSGSGTQLLNVNNKFGNQGYQKDGHFEDDLILWTNGQLVQNTKTSLYDNGYGGLVPLLQGPPGLEENLNSSLPTGCQAVIDYDTSKIYILNAPPVAEFLSYFNYASSLSGRQDSTADRGNTITKISARSTNQGLDGKLKLVVVK
tara:strand:+ start:323 stop:2206 length:1884 start_codon:yes stop_codon:yes gene_type:complete